MSAGNVPLQDAPAGAALPGRPPIAPAAAEASRTGQGPATHLQASGELAEGARTAPRALGSGADAKGVTPTP